MSELFAGAIQDRGRGALIGARSAGHGSAQTLVLLSSPKGQGRGAVRVTDRQFLRLAGSPIEGHGITPDIALEAVSSPGALDDETIARVLGAAQQLRR
jgi:carboxyl-terminal processing protease